MDVPAGTPVAGESGLGAARVGWVAAAWRLGPVVGRPAVWLIGERRWRWRCHSGGVAPVADVDIVVARMSPDAIPTLGTAP